MCPTGRFRVQLQGLILYGPYARGEQDDGSDIDLLVLFHDKPTADKGQEEGRVT